MKRVENPVLDRGQGTLVIRLNYFADHAADYRA
jgi:hypothetical protein